MSASLNHDSDLPIGWVRVPLGEVVQIGADKFNPASGKDVPYLGLEHIEKETGKILGHGSSSSVTSTKTVFLSGDLLYGRLRPYLCKVAVPKFGGVCSTDIIVLKKHPYISNPFLKYVLMDKRFLEYSILKTSGQHPRISTEDLLAFQLKLPPLAEQNRIVARLESLLGELDQTEAALQQAKIQAEEYRQAVLRDAFSGRLTGEVVGKGNLPEGWEWRKLGDECETATGGTPERSNSSYYFGEIPWVKSGELNHEDIFETEEKITVKGVENSAAQIFPKGTLLIALYGSTAGRLAFLGIDAATNQAVCAMLPTENLDKKYLYYFLIFQKEYLLNQRKGAAQPNLNQSILRELNIPLAPLTEQKEIVAKVETIFNDCDELDRTAILQTQKTQSLRQTLFQDAFAGKLVPQDPSDEPATQLLERIIAEKVRMAAEQKQRDTANRAAKKAKTQELEVPKTIVQVLKERGGTYPAAAVWRECEHKGDIEKFYAELKRLMDTEKTVIEDASKQNLILYSEN